jgi:hypothetical protein
LRIGRVREYGGKIIGRKLEQAISQYLQINNANPKPFARVKSADDILASIERFCLRVSNSGR